MSDDRIPLKNPIIAGVLAFLLPGAGHLYQGRMFKAGVYFFCILGLYCSGMAMAEWKAVQPPPKGPASGKKIAQLKYAAQLGVGLPAMYGLIQRERYYSEENQKRTPETVAFSAPFFGSLELYDEDESIFGEVQGTVHLTPFVDKWGSETLTGTAKLNLAGQTRELTLGYVELGRRIAASEKRSLRAGIVADADRPSDRIGSLDGQIPRSFWNWFQAPMEEEEVHDLHRRLGKLHEVAMVFTWVAGLLNVLAIWDAVEGPAYGYGDEKDEDNSSESSQEPTASA